MADPAKKEEVPSAEKHLAAAEPQKPILMYALALVNILAMVGVMFIVNKSHKQEEAKPKLQDVVEGEHQEQGEAKTEEHEEFLGKLIPLETFTVNISGTRGNKYVKINMELEVDGEKVEEEIEKRKPQIRDYINLLVASKTYEQMMSKEGKELLRDEIRDTINTFLVKGKIKKVFFTELVVN